MSKNLKLSFVLVFVACAISLAWNTLLNFFSGVGINFVAYFAITALLMIVVLTDKETKKRMMDLFVITIAFLVLESVIYFALEFGIPTYDLYKGMHIYQNVIAALAFLFLAYAIFRLVCEINGTKVGFVEVMLGNKKVQKKERQPKELSNGSLADKPKKNELETLDEDLEEQTIEIEEPAATQNTEIEEE